MINTCLNWKACYAQLIKDKGDFGGNEDVVLEHLAERCYFCMRDYEAEEGG